MNLIELLEKANEVGYKEAVAHERGHDAPDFEEWYCSEQTQQAVKNIDALHGVSESHCEHPTNQTEDAEHGKWYYCHKCESYFC